MDFRRVERPAWPKTTHWSVLRRLFCICSTCSHFKIGFKPEIYPLIRKFQSLRHFLLFRRSQSEFIILRVVRWFIFGAHIAFGRQSFVVFTLRAPFAAYTNLPSLKFIDNCMIISLFLSHFPSSPPLSSPLQILICCSLSCHSHPSCIWPAPISGCQHFLSSIYPKR